MDIVDEGAADVDRLAWRRAAPAKCLAVNTGIGFAKPGDKAPDGVPTVSGLPEALAHLIGDDASSS